MPAKNHHATVVVVGSKGVLLRGPSGAGKSELALALLQQAKAEGMFAILVADDQVFLSEHAGRLVARAPEAIAGLVEIRGLGPVGIGHEPAAVIDLIADLVPEPPRYQEPAAETIEGVTLPRFEVAGRNLPQATHVLLSLLR